MGFRPVDIFQPLYSDGTYVGERVGHRLWLFHFYLFYVLHSGTGVIRDTNKAGFVWEVYHDLTPPEYMADKC